MTHFYAICLLLSCLLVLVSYATEQDIDIKPISVSAADVPPDDTIRWGEVIVGDPTRNAWGTDAYVVNALPSIANDVLTLNVSYGGGCGAHAFTLITSGVFRESNPVRLPAVLAHHANGDRCEAWITETYHFNVSVLKERYRKASARRQGRLF